MAIKYKLGLVLVLVGLISLVAFPACTATESTETFPARSINLVIPSSAGGGFDLLSRVLVATAEQYVGHSLIPVIKSGAGQTLGTGFVAQEPADGYTWLVNNRTPFITAFQQELPYSFSDFTSIGQVTNEPMFIIVNVDSPYKTLKDLLDAAKAKPGEITVGTVGQLGLSPMVFEPLGELAGGIQWNYVPFDGGGPAGAAVAGGHTDTNIALPSVVASLLGTGKIRVLATSGDESPDFAPFDKLAIPTFKSQGYDYSVYNWQAFFIRSATPSPIVEKSRALLKEILDDPSTQSLLKKIGAVQAYRSGAEADAMITRDMEIMGKIFSAKK